ncbi:glycosyltransferase family 4 protein [Undibacterium flavidum]|uniref:Glycosyltransferase n=1 Tax=Undibacterium flavidum TaxID=2762297 RepID=A0ABR6Y8Z9_9BURK|nr:glycosyltransferase [Undibacterium flavidum]MBC3873059.1 glycosyltransferase [Undibacterium flavidum]
MSDTSLTSLPPSRLQQIHQIFSSDADDALINRMLSIRGLLRSLGFVSSIYFDDADCSDAIPEELKEDVLAIDQLPQQNDMLLFVHHHGGENNWESLVALPQPKVMIYRNMTASASVSVEADITGRAQLAQWAQHFVGAIGMSPANYQVLHSSHYANVATIPMLFDFEKWMNIQPEVAEFAHLRDAYNLLFVGNIGEDHQQLELVDLIWHLKHRSPTPVRLILAGAVTNASYKISIDHIIAERGLHDQVLFTGKLSDEKLIGLYRSVDAFVCLSAHEESGPQLIQAMRHKLPIVARASRHIRHTLGTGGLLLAAESNSWECAQAVWTLSQEPGLRRQIIERQLNNVERFSFDTVRTQLRDYLQLLQIDIPLAAHAAQAAQVAQASTADTSNYSVQLDHIGETKVSNVSLASDDWQIEGPFDSSYSLAIVNRELAKAFDQMPISLRLRSHEGHGDFAPAPDFLQADAACQRMYQAALDAKLPPAVALRFCYPPHLDDMPATVRAIHSYGWEETGFPAMYVEEFNRRLDLITVLSKAVEKILRDNGVRVPIAVTGAGVDHLLQVPAGVLPTTLTESCKEFRFLHISSCFPRKGVDALLRAYGAAFRAQDEVSLIIKTFPNVHNTVAAQLQELQLADAEFPHVVVVNEDWDDANIVALYQFADAFVAPSRGEGLGLPMAEAMLFELPVITTAWGGQTDFCDDTTAWCCDYTFQKTQTHMGLTHSLWAEPDQRHLAQLLRQIHTVDNAQKTKKIEAARQRVMRNLSWANTAQNVQAAVRALSQQAVLRREPKIAWISTWNARCGIANYSNYLTQAFPLSRFTVLANHIAERMDIDQSNVIRCWNASETGQLDYALEIIEEHGFDAVVIQYNFSFFSLATLAATIEALKAAGKQVHIFFHSTADVVLPEQTKSLRSIAPQLKLVDRIFVHGIDDMNRLKNWQLIDNVTYFPHGIALPPASVKHGNGGQTSTHSAQKTVIASYGFLLPHKGIPELIEAFSLLDHVNKNYHLLLVNALYPMHISTELKNRCIELIAKLGLQSKVSLLTDFLSEVETQNLLAQADLIVFPYQQTQESSSAAVRSGLASGRPVAVTPLAIFDDVDEAVTKLPGTTPADLAQGISQLLEPWEASDSSEVSNSRQEKKARADAWLQERRWPVLSRRLLNLIDGIANPLPPEDGTLC